MFGSRLKLFLKNVATLCLFVILGRAGSVGREKARFELPLADAFAQMLWIFSMRAVDVGALLLSAWLEAILQRRHCRVKDWPYSQAAIQAIQVCNFDSFTNDVSALC